MLVYHCYMPSFKKKKQKFTIILVLSDFRSVHNTASMFRIADCIGVSKIYLTGTTPTPLDKYQRLRNDFTKISLGSENKNYEYFTSFTECISLLKRNSFHIVGVEQHERSVDCSLFTPEEHVTYALVLFNEPYGADATYLSLCDTLLEISQYGNKESLNVTSAGSIILYKLFDR